MEKTNIFTSTTEIRELKIIANPRKFSNDVYVEQIDFIMSIYNLCKKILYAHSVEKPDTTGLEDFEIETLSDNEIRVNYYMDDIEKIDWGYIGTFIKEIGYELYFNAKNSAGLFENCLMEIKNIICNIDDRLNYGQPIDFNEMYREKFLYNFADLNFGIMCILDLFGVLHDKEYDFMRYYGVIKDINIHTLATEANDYYKQVRPHLELFDKYPELSLAIEEKVSSDFFFDLVNLSGVLKVEELKDIADGVLLVNDDFIAQLQERRDDNESSTTENE